MKRLFLIMAVLLILVGCGEPQEIKLPDEKSYESDLNIDGMTVTKSTGTLRNVVRVDEILVLDGVFSKDNFDKQEGRLGIKVRRVLRSASAKFRIVDEKLRNDLDIGKEWIIVELDVYNLGKGAEGFTFTADELYLTNKQGERYTSYDTGLDTGPGKVIVYPGTKEVLSVAAKVKIKDGNVLVALDKLIKETKQEKEVNESDEGPRYLSIKGVLTLRAFTGDVGSTE